MINFRFDNPTLYLKSLYRTTRLDELSLCQLNDQYGSYNRCYHGLFHIAFLWHCHCVLKSEFGGDDTLDDERIANAVACHDVVYDPRSKTNEIDSAKWWRTRAFQCPHLESQVTWVSDAIKASADHLSGDHAPDPLLHWFLGLDLMPLAAPAEIFDMHGYMLRAEYSHLPYQEWDAGRRKFLSRLRDETIYRHPILSIFETDAHANIERALTAS